MLDVGYQLGMNENYTFPTCEQLILSVGLEEAGSEQGWRGAQQCTGGSWSAAEKSRFEQILEDKQTWKVTCEGQVMGAAGVEGCRPEVEAGRFLKAMSKQPSLQFKPKVRGGQPGLNPAPNQARALSSHPLSIWVLAAPGWPGVLESWAEAPPAVPPAGSDPALPVVTTLFSV